MSYNSTVANLLVQENLTVCQAKVSTASFNVATRVLTLPYLKDQFEAAYGMLIAHECGHALFTTVEFNDLFIKSTRLMQKYYNICEDVRIERLIKRKYPGLRKDMAEGYDILNANNFFLPAKKDPNTLSLIDRVNCRFKIGHSCGVEFTAEEQILVDEVNSTETVEDVIIVAKKLYRLALKNIRKKREEEKKKQEGKKKAQQNKLQSSESPDEFEDSPDNGTPEEEAGSPEESSPDKKSPKEKSESKPSENEAENAPDSPEKAEGEEGQETPGASPDPEGEEESTPDSSEDGNSPESSGKSGGESSEDDEDLPLSRSEEEELDSVTQENIDDGLQSFVENNQKFDPENIWLEKYRSDFEPIVSYKKIISTIRNRDGASSETFYRVRFENYLRDTNKIVNHMVKEFETKKKADNYRHARVSKTGRLDMNKLYAFQLKNELFKQITVIPDGKNHGMVFLLDWSISMKDYLSETLNQLLTLTQFCRKVQIPFLVLAFTDSWKNIRTGKEVENAQIYWDSIPPSTVASSVGTRYKLLELLSSDMSDRDFRSMQLYLHSDQLRNHFLLGGTPLESALAYMHSFLPRYKMSRNIDNLTFTVLTDGESGSVKFKTRENGISTLRSQSFTPHSKLYDPITKECYPLEGDMTTLLLKMIKDSTKCSTLGFFVGGRRDLKCLIYENCKFGVTFDETSSAHRRSVTKTGWTMFSNRGYDKQYFILGKSLSSKQGYDPMYNPDMKAADLAKEMAKVNAAIVDKFLMGKVISEFAECK